MIGKGACDNIKIGAMHESAIWQKGAGIALQRNNWNAIAAMSRNRVIGIGGRLPWRLPADMAWFKKATDGQVLVLGRKTLESMRIHPQNHYIVLTRNRTYALDAPNVEVIHDLERIPTADLSGRSIWICGGNTIYQETLFRCRYLYLTTVKSNYVGDAFFPIFEDHFLLEEILHEDDTIIIQRYQNTQNGGHVLD